MKKREKDICIYYQDTRPNVWETLKKGLDTAYSLSVSIKPDCLCLQLTPIAGREDLTMIARCLTQLIVGPIQRLTMENLITCNQSMDTQDALDILVMLCMARAAQKGYSQSDRTYIKTIERRIVDCLKMHRNMHLEGFLTFRMRDMMGGWASCVEDVLQYVNAKSEYNAYMEVLRQFYRAQPCRCKRAVVRDTMGGGYLITADGHTIRIINDEANPRIQTPEEELMYMLLHLAPACIEINMMRSTHRMVVVNTLRLVFGAAVQECQ